MSICYEVRHEVEGGGLDSILIAKATQFSTILPFMRLMELRARVMVSSEVTTFSAFDM